LDEARIIAELMVLKNKSEMLLEGYLRSNGYTDFDFEPQLPGSSKHPDYRLRFGDSDTLLEVKEFRAGPDDLGAGGYFDPYPPLREKINEARDKFKNLKQYCCCLVVYNVDKPLVLLDWQHVYAAMLGNLGWSVPIESPGKPSLADTKISSIFMSGGKMHRERAGAPFAPQNQTVSAILVLGRVPAGQRLFHHEIREREAQQGKRFQLEEIIQRMELDKESPRDIRRRPLRVAVHENPYARHPLSPELFRGPWDERYGSLDGKIQQLFLGEEIAKLPSDA
jgi:hypothetical protein